MTKRLGENITIKILEIQCKSFNGPKLQPNPPYPATLSAYRAAALVCVETAGRLPRTRLLHLSNPAAAVELPKAWIEGERVTTEADPSASVRSEWPPKWTNDNPEEEETDPTNKKQIVMNWHWQAGRLTGGGTHKGCYYTLPP